MQYLADKSLSREAGFTIIELMVSMTVLAIILLVVAAGIMSFSNSYFKGINTSDTQAVARSVMDDIVQNIEFSPKAVTSYQSGDSQKFCIGNVSYQFVAGQEVDATTGSTGLVKQAGDCGATDGFSQPTATSLGSSQREMLGDHMRIANLDIHPQGSAYAVSLTIILGADDLLQNNGSDVADPNTLPALGDDGWADVGCKQVTGSQYCAVSTLATTVQQRI